MDTPDDLKFYLEKGMDEEKKDELQDDTETVPDSTETAPAENDNEVLKETITTEFPLSGGEPDITFFEIDTDTDEEKEQLKKQLDTEFPLSGGEV